MSTSTFTSTTTRQPVAAIADEAVTGTTLLAAAYGGKVRFSKVRSTGTQRHWPVLAKGSKERKAAEAIEARRAKGDTVEAIAKAMHKSVPTVRRTITALAFTRELEGLSAKDRAAVAKVANANRTAAPKEQAPAKASTKAPAKASKPASKGTSKPKAASTGKGGFKPETAAGKRAAARKAKAEASKEQANS